MSVVFSSRVEAIVCAMVVLVAADVGSAQQVADYSSVTDARLQNPEPHNWLMFRRTYDGWGYSPLEQINTRNVDELEVAWTVSTGITEGHQSPPVVNDGVMFVTTPMNQVHAIESNQSGYKT